MNIIGGEKAIILIWAWPSLYRYLSYVSMVPAMVIHVIDMVGAMAYTMAGAYIMVNTMIDAMVCAMVTTIKKE